MANYHDYTKWLRDSALPRSLNALQEKTGKCAENIFIQGIADWDCKQRIRVPCRMLLAYARGQEVWQLQNTANILAIEQFIETHYLQKDGGYCSHLQPDNKPIIGAVQSYDLAFVLLGYASIAKLGKTDYWQQKAQSCCRYLQRHLKAPNGGWLSVARQDFLYQNPQMHLLEAFVEWYSISNNPYWRQLALQMYDLFTRYLLQKDGLVYEQYDSQWQPLKQFQQIKIGHLFEWVFLLSRYQSVMQVDTTAQQKLLYQKGEELAAPFTGNFPEFMTANYSRCWGLLEMLKATIVLYGIDNKKTLTIIDQLFRHFLHPNGHYVDKIAVSDCQILDDRMHTSTLYHLATVLVS